MNKLLLLLVILVTLSTGADEYDKCPIYNTENHHCYHIANNIDWEQAWFACLSIAAKPEETAYNYAIKVKACLGSMPCLAYANHKSNIITQNDVDQCIVEYALILKKYKDGGKL